MTGGHDPRDVLAAVRRLETELADLRARAAAGRTSDLEGLRRALAADAARERRETVEDMEALVDLMGTAWRSTGDRIAVLADQIGALAGQIGEIRVIAEEARHALSGARVEVRLAGPATNGDGVDLGARPVWP